MQKSFSIICIGISVFLYTLLIMPFNRTFAEVKSVTTKDDFLSKMNTAQDGDIIKLENDLTLIAGDYGLGDCFSVPQNCLVTLDLNGKTINIGSGNASNNFGVGANSALLIKNGFIENIDTNDSDTGILILSGVTITNNLCSGSTQMWIVNNSSIQNILLVEAGGVVNPGTDVDMHPLSDGLYDNGYYSGYENPAPAMVGSGVTWKCLNTLQDDFTQANNDTTGTYTNIIFLKDSELENDSSLTAGGVTLNLCGYTLTTDSKIISIDNDTGTNKIQGGTIIGDLDMNDLGGDVILLSLDVTGNVSNDSHKLTINSGHYNNIVGGDNGKVKIDGGYYSGVLTGSNYEISGGYYVNKPDHDYIVSGKWALKCSVLEKGITYNYKIGDHTHDWKYYSNNNYLYAYCDADVDCEYYGSEADLDDSLKLILSIPSNNVYSGQPIEATIDQNNSDIDDWTDFFGSLPTIEYEAKNGVSLTNNKAVNIGSYTASISESGKKAKVDFNITRKNTVSGYKVPNTGVE